MDLRRRLAVEALGCGLLVVAFEGAHHLGDHLGASATEGRLFMSLALGAVLACLTLVLKPFSGAHFNPALTFADALGDGTPWREVPRYALAQVLGGLAGRLLAHFMCGEPLLLTTRAPAASSAQFVTEVVATFGLLVVVRGCVRSRPSATPLAISAYVAATVWFTDSRSLANPALVLARAASARLGVMRPLEVESFVAAQLLGAALAVCLFRWLLPREERVERPQEAELVIFECPVPGPAHLAAALFNALAHPQRARAVVAQVPGQAGAAAAVDAVLKEAGLGSAPLRRRVQEPARVVTLKVAGSALCALSPMDHWSLPALDLSSEEGARELYTVLRPRVRQWLAQQGWERLHAVASTPSEGPQAVT